MLTTVAAVGAIPLLASAADAQLTTLLAEWFGSGRTRADVAGAEGDLRRIADRYFTDPQLREAFVLRGLAALNTVRKNRNTLNFAANPVAQYSKGLARVGSGPDPALPEPALHEKMVQALSAAYRAPPTSNPTDYEAIERDYKVGATYAGENDHLRWTDPLGGLSHDLEGIDASASYVAPSPTFSGATTAGEMVELYWFALLRDTSLLAFSSTTLAAAKSEDQVAAWAAVWSLAQTTAYRGVTLDRAFRLTLRRNDGSFYGFRGVDKGPYLSQFLAWQKPNGGPINFGSLRLDLRQQSVPRKTDFLFDPADRGPMSWYAVQDGSGKPIGALPPAGELRFIDTVRDGTNYAHFDKIYLEYLIASCIMLAELPSLGASLVARDAAMGGGDVGSREHIVAEQGDTRADLLNFGNPYYNSYSQVGFATFGLTHAVTLLSEVATRAHKAAWYQKWLQMRLRPEEFGGRLHAGRRRYNFHPDITGFDWPGLRRQYRPDLDSPDSWLLPMAYPEGSPTHPAYPSGHAAVAGASVTALKAMFDETLPLIGAGTSQKVRVPVRNGTELAELDGMGLTVGGELNKLASNISYFRTMSGVHWASDGLQGALLGEQVAISMIAQQSQTSSAGQTYRVKRTDGVARPAFRLSMFSGQRIEIRDGAVFLFAPVDENSPEANARQADWAGLSSRPISLSRLFLDYQGFLPYD